jgi:hypothetical protein
MMFLKRLQNLPEKKKKIIFWSTLLVLFIGLIIWYAGHAQQVIKNFQAQKFIESLNLPDIKMPQLPQMPNLEIIENNVQETTTTQEN